MMCWVFNLDFVTQLEKSKSNFIPFLLGVGSEKELSM